MELRRFLPLLAIAAACAGLLIFFAQLYQKAETPPWRGSENAPSAPSKADKRETLENSEKLSPFRFLSYNVKNWLSSTQNPDKTEASKTAVLELIIAGQPDVIGLSEIGSESDVSEIQQKLSERGLELPYSHHSGGTDPVRHLAILSRFPISHTQEPDPMIPGTPYSVQRGILDATIQIGGEEIRFLGLHLKSRRAVADVDQEILRVAEAKHIRKYVDVIFSKNPKAKLVVYGDWNNPPKSLSTRTLLGTYRTPEYLSLVHVADSRGDRWTHYWAQEDSYSRIDFVSVSRQLRKHVDSKGSKILDGPAWKVASDHRPLLVKFGK